MKERGSASFIFLSRIARIKNLDFAMKVISQVSGASLDIYGPAEDQKYWAECKPLLSDKIRYCDPVEHGLVIPTFAEYEFSILPSKSESFGHAIADSLRAGIPALISDKTPWKLDNEGITLPLIESEWIRAVEWCVDCDLPTYRFMAESAFKMSCDPSRRESAISATANMFRSALNSQYRCTE